MAIGLKPGTTLAQIKEEIHAGTLEASLNVLPVAVGDMIYVDAGTVHAIWPGSILLETQQNADITYRLFDYRRPRELHIEKSLEATRLRTRAGKVAPRKLIDRTVLIDVEYFRMERISVSGSRTSESLRGQASAGSRIFLQPPVRDASQANNSNPWICPRVALSRCRQLHRSLCWKTQAARPAPWTRPTAWTRPTVSI